MWKVRELSLLTTTLTKSAKAELQGSQRVTRRNRYRNLLYLGGGGSLLK